MLDSTPSKPSINHYLFFILFNVNFQNILCISIMLDSNWEIQFYTKKIYTLDRILTSLDPLVINLTKKINILVDLHNNKTNHTNHAIFDKGVLL
jgi:hypothetical protein